MSLSGACGFCFAEALVTAPLREALAVGVDYVHEPPPEALTNQGVGRLRLWRGIATVDSHDV